MRRVRLPATAAALAALAIGLAACGEKEEPEPSAPTVTAEPVENGGGGGGDAKAEEPNQDSEADLVRTVRRVIGGGEPAAVCGSLVTSRYLRQAYGNEQGCRAALGAQNLFGVEVTQVEIDGARATADAEPKGGPNKGETIKVELIEEGATWKVDSALSNAPPGP